MRTFPLTNRGLTLPAIVTLVLVAALAALLASGSAASAQGSAPDTPDRPTGTAVFIGGVDLEWNDMPGADSYDVQLFRNGQWIDLPGDGIEIAFYGAGAIISELNHGGSSYWFQVRAKNAHGSSDWSEFFNMNTTSEYRLGRQARPDNVLASGAPVIDGTAQVGETLTADTTGIEDGNGLDRVEFRFQWVSNDGSADTDITGATASTYTLAADDEGKTIKVRVAFTDRGGYAESLTSDATAAMAGRPNSPATGAPVITGTAQVGETLTADTSGIADTDGLANVSYSYQWIANDGTSDTDIAGATDSTYTLTGAEAGRAIKLQVTFTDDSGHTESLTSEPTPLVTTAVQIQSHSEAASFVTVVVSEDTSAINDEDINLAITWRDADGCSTNYNAYFVGGGFNPPGNQIHLGSASSDSVSMTKGIARPNYYTGGFVKLYCGTDELGRLVASVRLLSDWGSIQFRTYTEPPIGALRVSHGTLTPILSATKSRYDVPDVANAETRITITAPPMAGYAVAFYEGGNGHSLWGSAVGGVDRLTGILSCSRRLCRSLGLVDQTNRRRPQHVRVSSGSIRRRELRPHPGAFDNQLWSRVGIYPLHYSRRGEHLNSSAQPPGHRQAKYRTDLCREAVCRARLDCRY